MASEVKRHPFHPSASGGWTAKRLTEPEKCSRCPFVMPKGWVARFSPSGKIVLCGRCYWARSGSTMPTRGQKKE